MRALRVSVAFTVVTLAAPGIAAAAGVDPGGMPPPAEDPGGMARRLAAARADHAPVIDGRFDDAVWQKATPDDRFTQIQPDQGSAPTERTEFRILYDDDHVYVAVSCYDSDAAGIVSRLTRRDRDIEADWVAVSFDSRNDKNSAYTFQLSAAGVQVDGQFFNDADFNIDWDAVWTGAVTRDDRGWYAEFAIPLTVLRFSSEPVQSWGVQVHRNISRKREQTMWSYSQGGAVWGVSRFGRVEGLEGLKPRRTLEIRPYVMTRVSGRTESGGGLGGLSAGSTREGTAEIGLDAKVGLTSRLTLDLSVNPDFGQVEADQVVLNLSRFETFFPEKRPFFLEGVDIFSTPINLFYSRRLGRPAVGLGVGDTVLDGGMPLTVTAADGSLRLWAAAKVTGDAPGGITIGVMGALVGEERVDAVDAEGDGRRLTLAPLRSYAVVRGRYSLGGNNFVGVMATGVTRLDGSTTLASADHDGYVQAVDGRWQSEDHLWRNVTQIAVSERVGGPSYRLRAGGGACSAADAMVDPGCVPISRADGTFMGDGAVGVGVQSRTQYQSKSGLLKVEYTGHSAKFDANDAGFAPRFNLNELKLVGGWMNNKPGDTFNSTGLFLFGVSSMSMDGVLQYASAGVDLEAQFKNFTGGSVEMWLGAPRSYDIYESLDGARFEKPVAWEGNGWFGTNQAKAFAAQVYWNWSLGLDERQRRLSGGTTLSWQAASNVELALSPEGGVEQAMRFYDCETDDGFTCVGHPGAHHYTWAELDSRYLSLTFRGTMTIAPPLSIQAYAQYFTAEGSFSDYREVDTMGEKPTIDREDLRPSSFDGDFDGDGMADDGFEVSSLNVNLVLRWELVPGSTMFLVYTRAQDAPHARLRDLDRGPTEDVLLLKLVFFAG